MNKAEELLRLLRELKEKRIFISVLGSPDPDGLASAWALKIIARFAGVDSDIFYFEELSRPDNIQFLQSLEIPARMATKDVPWDGMFEGYAAVDRQNPALPFPLEIPLLIHIDHHADSTVKALFSYKREDVGSTSTIMTGLLEPFLDKVFSDEDEQRRLCTALMFGIRTDTMDFITATAEDFEASSTILPFVDTGVLRKLSATPLGMSFLKTLEKALGSMKIKKSLLVAYAGSVPSIARDSIGQAADFLLRLDGVETAIVFGVVKGYVVGSLRTKSDSLDTVNMLRDALEPVTKSHVDLGGRRFAGGFQIPVRDFGNLANKHIGEVLEQAFHKHAH
jgi:nanoRNase/pAp phosphatase (c-di-AMP/oligoRNAs hydrolase)